METLKTATDWAKAEVFSTSFFILFGVGFVLASLGFWQLGKTEIAKAYIIPTLAAGVILLTIGLGLFFTNISRVSSFESDYQKDSSAFVKSELVRVEATLKEYQTVVFKIIPFMIVIAALLIAFVDKPIWRASAITTIAMLIVVLLVDGTAHSRIEAYNEQLKSIENQEKINLAK